MGSHRGLRCWESPDEVARHLRWSETCDVVVKASGVGVLDEELEARVSGLPASDL